jgi:dTDP-4-dehydrorhamnose 3,5-epimerase
MLPGISIKSLRRFPDERGFFTEIYRSDWKTLLSDDSIVQANLSITNPQIVRAWHRHERDQVDYFVVIKGALKICAFDDVTCELNEIISTGENIQAVRIPGHYWHGFKVVSPEPALLVYFVNNLYQYNNPDELRKPWNNQTIIPKKINGKTSDPRIGKPYDWFYPPHK